MKPFATLADIESRLATMATLECEVPGLSELDHALQCATALKAMGPDDEELQIAGLLHDVAQGQCDFSMHGEIGARAIRPLLGERVAELVRLHVDAKRYLVTTDPTYRARLSRESVYTLGLQGGDMTADEIAEFASGIYWQDALKVRNADEAAKIPGRRVSALETWIPALHRVGGGRR